MSTAAAKNEVDVEAPKPPTLVLSDFEAAAQMCEHEWLAHASGMSEGPGDNGAAASAPRGGGAQPQFAAGRTGATTPIDDASSPSPSSSPLPSTPSTSDDDEGLDLVPEWRRGSTRGGARGARASSSRLPLTSPAISDGGGLRDEHVEDSWSDDSEEESVSGGGGNEGDNERSSASGAAGTNGSGTPHAATAGPRRRSHKLGGSSGGVRRALLPFPPHHATTSTSSLPPPPPGENADKRKKKKKSRRQRQRLRSLRAPGRHFTVVTTASLPWMTGTSVNPTLRSAYLARALPRSAVTLLLPWLPASQQGCVFPKGVSFESPRQQEEHVREWIRQRTGFDPPGLRITWYHARYCPVMKSIFPYGGEDEEFFLFSRVFSLSFSLFSLSFFLSFFLSFSLFLSLLLSFFLFFPCFFPLDTQQQR